MRHNTPLNSRYDDLIRVFGKPFVDKLGSLKYFMVGCGALGCELIKNFALCGVCCGEVRVRVRARAHAHTHLAAADAAEREVLDELAAERAAADHEVLERAELVDERLAEDADEVVVPRVERRIVAHSETYSDVSWHIVTYCVWSSYLELSGASSAAGGGVAGSISTAPARAGVRPP